MQDVQLGLIVAILPALAGATSNDDALVKTSNEEKTSNSDFDVADTLKLVFSTLVGMF